MRNPILCRSFTFLSLSLVFLFPTGALGQSAGQREAHIAHTKVPAVSHASYSAPEPAPTLQQTQRQASRSAATTAPAANVPQRSNPQRQTAAANRRTRHPVQQAAYQTESIQPSPMQMEEVSPMVEPFNYGDGNIGNVGGGGCGCPGNCASPCGDQCCSPCCPDPCATIWQNLEVFGGVQGFKNPADQGVNGNFGFHEGMNWGGPVFEYGGIGGQLGFQSVQSNLAESYIFNDSRIQFFFTTGLFHRPMNNHGWQGGVAWDWLHDNFYTTMNVSQLRAEVSWLSCGRHEVGFWTAIGTTPDTNYSPINDEDVTWDPIDMYALFYRRYFQNGGIARFSGGFTGDGQGLLGADAIAPLSNRVALVVNANYIIGRNDPAPEESLTESWGLTISLAFYPGYKSPCSSRNPYRPMFSVADNTSMMLNYRGPSFD